jgi:hypothetical protein
MVTPRIIIQEEEEEKKEEKEDWGPSSLREPIHLANQDPGPNSLEEPKSGGDEQTEQDIPNQGFSPSAVVSADRRY